MSFCVPIVPKNAFEETCRELDDAVAAGTLNSSMLGAFRKKLQESPSSSEVTAVARARLEELNAEQTWRNYFSCKNKTKNFADALQMSGGIIICLAQGVWQEQIKALTYTAVGCCFVAYILVSAHSWKEKNKEAQERRNLEATLANAETKRKLELCLERLDKLIDNQRVGELQLRKRKAAAPPVPAPTDELIRDVLKHYPGSQYIGLLNWMVQHMPSSETVTGVLDNVTQAPASTAPCAAAAAATREPSFTGESPGGPGEASREFSRTRERSTREHLLYLLRNRFESKKVTPLVRTSSGHVVPSGDVQESDEWM